MKPSDNNPIEARYKRKSIKSGLIKFIVIGFGFTLLLPVAARLLRIIPSLNDPEVQRLSSTVYEKATEWLPDIYCADWSAVAYSKTQPREGEDYGTMRYDTCQSDQIVVDWRETAGGLIIVRVATYEGEEILFERDD